MVWLAIAALAWALVGLSVGLSRARLFPGPQDSLTFAAVWMAAWPLFWLCEDSEGDE